MNAQPTLPATPAAREAATSDPVYEDAGRPGQLYARFSGGARVKVSRGRARAYPGLVSEAPPTRPFYEMAALELAGARRVLDAGCGAGLGARLLARSLGEVVGIDSDAEAIEFAMREAPLAAVTCASLERDLPFTGFDGIVAIDVLGHVADALRSVTSLSRTARPEARLFVAEAAAHPTQALRSPARRAFTPRSLAALLAYGGFDVESWITREGSFVALSACKVDDDATRAVDEAERALARGDSVGARACLQRAAGSSRPALAHEAALAAADLAFALGDGDDAIRGYFAVRESGPDDPRPLTGLSRVSHAIGRHDDAISLAESATRLDPCDAGAAIALAMALEEGSIEAALPAWRAASRLAPDSLAVASRVAVLAREARVAEVGVAALERVRSYRDPLGAPLHVELARAYLDAGRTSEARIEAKLAAVAAPTLPDARQLATQFGIAV